MELTEREIISRAGIWQMMETSKEHQTKLKKEDGSKSKMRGTIHHTSSTVVPQQFRFLTSSIGCLHRILTYDTQDGAT